MGDVFYEEPATKACRRCKVEKKIDDFSWTKSRRKARYHRGTCKKCDREWHAANNKTDRRKHSRRVTNLARVFNLTIEDYESMASDQGDVCAICLLPNGGVDSRTGKVRPLVIDHDHISGEVRALLCDACNAGLGMFKDDPRLLQEAISYLQKHQDLRGV